MIWCSGLRKSYGPVAAVADVSFEIPAGTIGALLGPNGAGKSTLLKMLTGLAVPDAGEAAVCGVDARSPRVRQIIGVLPEDLGLFDLLTVREHLRLTAAVFNVASAEADARIAQLLRVLRLDSSAGTLAQECSYGTRKKTALAMALLPNPNVLFLDEPFEGVDPVTSETIRVQLRAAADNGITVLLSSHILPLVDRIADSVMLMKQGKIVFAAETASLTKSVEDLYFEYVEPAETERLEWLRS